MNCKSIQVQWLFTTTCLVLLSNAQYWTSETCYSSNDCNINCGGYSKSLSNALTTNNGVTLRYFSLMTNQYQFGVLIPICGNYPRNSPQNSYPDFGRSHIWQTSTTNSGDQYMLGRIELNTISRGWLYGSETYRFSFSEGDYCNSAYPYGRSTIVYLVCSTEYSANDPYITVSETEVCRYSISIYMREVCIAHSPVQSPTQVPATTTSSGTNKSTTIILYTVFTIVLIIILGGVRYCRKLSIQRLGKTPRRVHCETSCTIVEMSPIYVQSSNSSTQPYNSQQPYSSFLTGSQQHSNLNHNTSNSRAHMYTTQSDQIIQSSIADVPIVYATVLDVPPVATVLYAQSV